MNLCVFCASSRRSEPAFGPLADATGAALAAAGHTLVWGGGSTGLMGRVARAAQAGGARVVGVIPESMTGREIAYADADELVVTQTMRQRKQVMDDRSDAFLVLPGGFGTLEELSEVITHRFLNFHAKPVVILNHDGFYDPLLALFERFYATGLASDGYRKDYRVADTLDEALSALASAFNEPRP